ncbi:hypothetical protein TNCV_2128241 [Trichonephila clavipes]|nr:hypothetical protein TNCV_2128241 [Trichonephila clavipes]
MVALYEDVPTSSWSQRFGNCPTEVLGLCEGGSPSDKPGHTLYTYSVLEWKRIALPHNRSGFYSWTGQGRLSLSSLRQWHWWSRCRLTTWSGHLLMHLSAQWSRTLG